MLDQIKAAFRRKTHLEMAVEELEQAKRDRLQAQSAQEWATSMAAYHAARIERLTDYLKGQE